MVNRVTAAAAVVRADIGYVSKRGDFFVLASVESGAPPKAGSTRAIDIGGPRWKRRRRSGLAMSQRSSRAPGNRS